MIQFNKGGCVCLVRRNYPKGKETSGNVQVRNNFKRHHGGLQCPLFTSSFLSFSHFFSPAVFRISSFKCIILRTNPKGNQPWISIGRTDAEVEAAILWPPDGKSWLIGKDPDARKDWGQEKRATEDEMIGCHHQLNKHESEQTSADSEGQGSLVCYSSWGHKESTRLNWTEQIRELPWWINDKKSACKCRRCGFDLWVRKIPFRKQRQTTAVFLPG